MLHKTYIYNIYIHIEKVTKIVIRHFYTYLVIFPCDQLGVERGGGVNFYP